MPPPVPRGVDHTSSPGAEICLRLQKWEPLLSCPLLGPKPSSVSEVCLPQIHRLGSCQLGEEQGRRVRRGHWSTTCALGASSGYYCRIRPAGGKPAPTQCQGGRRLSLHRRGCRGWREAGRRAGRGLRLRPTRLGQLPSGSWARSVQLPLQAPSRVKNPA